MKIAFNPSTANALTTISSANQHDIIFDLKGRNIFARGVKFFGTDTQVNVIDNLTSNDSKSALSANMGRYLNLIKTPYNNTSTPSSAPSAYNIEICPITSVWYSSLSIPDGGGGLLIRGNTGTAFNLWLHDTSNVWYKQTASGAWKKMDAGNADTASKFQTARTINGTSFDGSSNIVTSYWGTSRNITIGNTTKSVNGSGNISWTLSEIGVQNTWRQVNVNGTSIGSATLNLVSGNYIGVSNDNGKVTFNLIGSTTTANQAILSNGTANQWKLQTLNIDNWNNAWNWISSITTADTDKVINKWNEILNFLAGIDSSNKLNTLLNSKLSITQIAAKSDISTLKNNAIYWVDTKNNASGLTNGPFTNNPFAMLSITNYNAGTFSYRSRLAFNDLGEIKVAKCHSESSQNWTDTWYNILTSNNSGISGSTIKINGTSITVNSSTDADNKYVKKAGDTMTGALNFGAAFQINNLRVIDNEPSTSSHKLVLGYSGFNKAEWFEYGGTWNFYKTSNTQTLLVQLGVTSTFNGQVSINSSNFGALSVKRNDDSNGASIQFRGNTNIYGYIGFNNSARDKQLQRWNSAANTVYTILDTSSTRISDSVITINDTSITVSKSDHNHDGRYVRYYTVTSLDCNNLANGFTAARATASNAADGNHSAFLYVSDVGTPFQLQFPDASNFYVYKRYKSSGSWSAWAKLSAGYADHAGYLDKTFTVFGVEYNGSQAKSVIPSNFVSQLSEGTSTVTDGTMLITSYASNNGFADSNAVNIPYKRKAIHLWEYIANKADVRYTRYYNNHDLNIDSFTDQNYIQTAASQGGGWTGTSPSGSHNGKAVLNVHTHTGNYYSQLMLDTAQNRLWMRSANNTTTYGNWFKIAYVSDIPTKDSWNYDERYLKLTGGTMAGTAYITWADSGSQSAGTGAQGARGGLKWSGQSDYAWLYAEETAGDNLDLVIKFGDDNSNGLSIRNVSNVQTTYISANGIISTGTFKGNLDWSYITSKPSFYTKAESDAKYVTSLGTSGRNLTWTKNGTTNNITVPFATYSSALKSTGDDGNWYNWVYWNGSYFWLKAGTSIYNNNTATLKTAVDYSTVSSYLIDNGTHNETASGTTANASNAGMLYGSGMYMTKTYSDSTMPTSYGNVINVAGTGSGQLLLGWSGSDSTTGNIYYRSHRDTNSGGWGSWRRLLYSDESIKNPNPIKFRDINGNSVSYDGSSTVDLTAGTYIAKLPYGFSSWSSGVGWGNTTGTSFASWNDSTGGSIDFRRDNPSSGKMSIKVDGRVYVNEGLNPVLSSSYDNGFWGIRTPDGGNNWIRTPNNGLIPYVSGGAGSGHSSLGTSSWYFSTAYIDKVYGSLVGNADTVDGYHASDLFTALSNSNNGITMTIGGTTRSISNIKVGSASVLSKNSVFNDSNTGNLSYFDGYISNTSNSAAWSAPLEGWCQIIHNDLSVTNYWTELAFPVNDVHGLAWRQRRDTKFYGWYRILDSNNYNNYVPTKTGTGASGTWGINISGTAANADKLGGYSASGLFTTLSNSNYGVSLTIGGTTKSISNISVNYAKSASNADLLDGYHASNFASSSHNHDGRYAISENYGGFIRTGRLPISGFYQSYESTSGGNAPWTSWVHLINCQHSNTSNNYALQIAASFYDNNTFKIRVTNNNIDNTWRDIIHSGNIASQSVSYADNAGTVDGYHVNDPSISSTRGQPFGKIPVVYSDGVMEVGRYLDFHYNNTSNTDFSTRLYSEGDYSNYVRLPSTSGTLALTSQIPTIKWAIYSISDSTSYSKKAGNTDFIESVSYSNLSEDTLISLKSVITSDNSSWLYKTFVNAVALSSEPVSLSLHKNEYYTSQNTRVAEITLYTQGKFSGYLYFLYIA